MGAVLSVLIQLDFQKLQCLLVMKKDANAKLDKTTGTIGVFYNFKQFLKMKYYVARFDTS